MRIARAVRVGCEPQNKKAVVIMRYTIAWFSGGTSVCVPTGRLKSLK